MIQENLIRYKIEARELTEKLGITGELSFITYNNIDDTIIIEVLIKGGA